MALDHEFTESEVRQVFANNGYIPSVDRRVEIRDLVSTHTAPMLLPRVIEEIALDAVEPYTIGTSLLQRVEAERGVRIQFTAFGGVAAASVVAEGEEYPEFGIAAGGSTVVANVNKVGLQFKLTEEMIEHSRYDLINRMIRLASFDLARFKEERIFSMISALGKASFDNDSTTSSIHGATTGRDLSGAANGSVTMDDIFDAMGDVMTRGYMPDTLIMHPLTWLIWCKDPTLRAFALANGGGTFFAAWTGNPASRSPWPTDGRHIATGKNVTPGGNAASATASSLPDFAPFSKAAPQLPSYFPFPFRIVVSPFVSYDESTKLTEIYVVDSRWLGAIAVEEDLNVGRWDDPARDIQLVKLREKYGLVILEDGLGIATLKNVKVVPNEIVLPPQSTISVSGSVLGPLTATTSPL